MAYLPRNGDTTGEALADAEPAGRPYRPVPLWFHTHHARTQRLKAAYEALKDKDSPAGRKLYARLHPRQVESLELVRR